VSLNFIVQRYEGQSGLARACGMYFGNFSNTLSLDGAFQKVYSYTLARADSTADKGTIKFKDTA
jgi:hypothetical protein